MGGHTKLQICSYLSYLCNQMHLVPLIIPRGTGIASLTHVCSPPLHSGAGIFAMIKWNGMLASTFTLISNVTASYVKCFLVNDQDRNLFIKAIADTVFNVLFLRTISCRDIMELYLKFSAVIRFTTSPPPTIPMRFSASCA